MKESAIVFSALFFLCLAPKVYSQKTIPLSSPDKSISLTIHVTDRIDFSVSHKNIELLQKAAISLQLQNEVLGQFPKLVKTEMVSKNEKINPVVPLKFSELSNQYNGLILTFQNDFQLEFRVLNNGMAYRFITTKADSITVVKENADYQLAGNYKAFLSKTGTDFSSYENVFKPVWTSDFKSEETAILPVFLDAQKAKIWISEADLYDYPAMFLKGGDSNMLSLWQPQYPISTEPIVNSWWGDRRLNITKKADYIARTNGTRSFPWRVFAITEEDKDIATNQLVYLLSRPSQFTDFSWIEPGQTSWEWWHASNIIGVDFKSGYNTQTYKYYIDFAARYGMRYMLMDEGWSFTVTDISKPNPDIDLNELVAYGKQKNVKLILWASWLAVEMNPNFFEQVKNIGAAGVKIDFMDRSDQWMMNYYERTARKAFENKLLVDFHGSISPRGLERAYPNIISYEAVTGMEQNKEGGHDLPDNRVILPFTRNVAGPMDYTPGAMNSVHPKFWHANWRNPMSIGTRAHQLALFVVFESGLQMLADNPYYYFQNEECTKFMTSVPTTWDETIVLQGKIGEYIVVAKRQGNSWYIGGITNKDGRELTLDFSFLKKESNYSIDLFTDGANAENFAIDYKKELKSINPDDKMQLKLSPNGGFAGIIKMKD
jgi:alpha-glucosidase